MQARFWFFLVLIGLTGWPLQSHAWWDSKWSNRKTITVDASAKGANTAAEVADVPVLIRLHTGNFSDFFALKENAADLRFLAEDDKTLLKHHVEKFDPVNEMALIWVRLPKLAAGAKANVWMYYGNADAPAADDPAATYDAEQALVYHFDGATPQDKTANANHAAKSTALTTPASLIAAGARFTGRESIQVPASASLQLAPEKGWTFSAWIKFEGPQKDAYLLHAVDGDRAVIVAVDGTNLYARYAGQDTRRTSVALTPGNWHHVALAVSQTGLALFVNGTPAATLSTAVTLMNPAVTLGAAAQGTHGWSGEMDETQIARVARSVDWLKLAVRAQSADASAVIYGKADAGESGGSSSYFGTILRNLTVDGWVVIFILVVMSVISWIVMVSKALVLNRTRKDDEAFLQQFHKLSPQSADALDRDDAAADEEDSASVYGALFGKHDHFQSSVLFHVFHAGMRDLKSRRIGQSVGAQSRGLSAKAVTSVRAVLDAASVREAQKLNKQMVLLTIAISGGPFLGLLGTVIGVMITFAAIAATGDVNINAIAPGISAALAATVVGLAVAIPALFGYNYLGTQVRELTAQMRVFVDEFMGRIVEHYGE